MGLDPLPAGFASTREALHAVAERLVAPARKPDNEIALTPTPGGFGTPEFELDGERLRFGSRTPSSCSSVTAASAGRR